LCGLQTFSAFDCPAIFSKTPKDFPHFPKPAAAKHVCGTAPGGSARQHLCDRNGARGQSAPFSLSLNVATGRAFDEFLIRSEHQLACGASAIVRTRRNANAVPELCAAKQTRTGFPQKDRCICQLSLNWRPDYDPSRAAPSEGIPQGNRAHVGVEVSMRAWVLDQFWVAVRAFALRKAACSGMFRSNQNCGGSNASPVPHCPK